MFERFSGSARQAIIRSQEEAAAVGAVAVGPEHILAALAAQTGSVASSVLHDVGVTSEAIRRTLEAEDAEALGAIGISLDSVRTKVDHALGEGVWNQALADFPSTIMAPSGRKQLELPFTVAGKEAIISSLGETRKLRQRVITPEHILLALVGHEDMVDAVLRRLGASPTDIRDRVLAELAPVAER